MDFQRFERLSSTFSSRFSRRNSLKLSGLGVSAALGGLALHQSTIAQESTPIVIEGTPTPFVENHLGLPQGQRTYTMFVQTAQSGTWTEKSGEEGVYTLTLTGLPAQTVYFSDRPERIVGTQTTSDFLAALGFAAENPPNAALVTSTDVGQDILVIELFNPVYTEGADASGATLTYDARILESYHETNLGGVAELQSDPASMPASFEGASLFIDDCKDGRAACGKWEPVTGGSRWYQSGDSFSYGCCWDIINCIQCHTLQGYCTTYIPGCEDGTCSLEFSGYCNW